MTTDRTAAPSRGTALADRPAAPAAGRTPAPSTDVFSALLGAATPKNDTPVRRDDNGASRRDDDLGRTQKCRTDDVRQPQRADDKRPATNHLEDKPAAEAEDAVAAAPEDAAAEEKPSAPNVFALLISPLPPQAAATAEAPAETPAPPVFPEQVPASVAAATAAQATVTASAASTTATAAVTDAATTAAATAAADTAKATKAATAAATAEATPGAIALQDLATEATADPALPAGADLAKPQAQAPAPASQATSAQDPATLPSSPRQSSADAQPQDQPNTPTPNANAVPQAKPSDAPAPVATQPATSPIAPAAAPAMPSLPHVERAVPLSRAVATTGVMVHMMTAKGVDHARLNLKPAELGGIEVRLRSTGNGIHALLVADSPEAARMLAAAGNDLRRQLEDKNVNLLSLDVSTSDPRQDQPARFSAGFGDDRSGPGRRSNMSASGANERDLLMDGPESAESTLVLPDGVHVDVLA